MARRHTLLFVAASLLVMATSLFGVQGAQAYTVGHDGNPVHEYIVDRAAALCSSAEVAAMVEQIKAGAEHEDLHDDVTDRSGIGGLFTTITHFWDGDKGPYDPVDMVIVGENGISAWQKAEVLWGMALGEYRSGQLNKAYEHLGHVAHLLADMSVPAHAHEDSHASDYYEDWMTLYHAILSEAEWTQLLSEGPVEIPEGTPFGPLYYLFYSMNQIGDRFPSDDDPADADWNPAYGDWIGELYASLGPMPWLSQDDLEHESNLEIIRHYSYLYAIRSVASLLDLFDQQAGGHAALTVVIDRVIAIDSHEEPRTDGPDFFARVWINGTQYWNEGMQIEDTDDISPGWAFGRNVGTSGTAHIVIQIWDEDEDPDDDDKTDLDPVEGARDIDLDVNLDTGAISGDLGGMCGATLTTEGAGDDNDYSRIFFRVLLPNIPPTADAGDDQTVDEGDWVDLDGTFTDPNWEDTHTFLWHLESSTNGQAVADSTSQHLGFEPNDNGEYTFSFTVTDNFGASDTDEVVITVQNVPPLASIDSLTDELGAELGVDVPAALVGLEIDLSGTFTDVGTADTHTAQISWGDGAIDQQTAFSQFVDCTGGIEGFLHHSHVYHAPGTYTITLDVTDDDGGVSTQTRQVEIVDAAGAIAIVVEALAPFADEPDVQAALDKLQGEQGGEAANGALDMLDQGNLNAALEKIKQALGYMEAAEAANPSLDFTYEKGLLALAGKSLALGAISEAQAVAYKPTDLAKIQAAMILVAEGDTLLGIPDYIGAVNKYQEAAREIQGTT